MKHKYTVLKDASQQQVVIQEYAELDKEMFSLLCEERYPEADIRSAMDAGEDALIAAFRTLNFYPTFTFATRIAGAIKTLLHQSDSDPQEVVIDDADFLHRQRPEQPAETNEEGKDESDAIDDLLEDGVEENFEDIDIEKINTGIKIADDDNGDPDDET